MEIAHECSITELLKVLWILRNSQPDHAVDM
jgi:hypothetical protein